MEGKMMRRFYAISASVVVALALGALTAGAASAKTVLQLKEPGGGPVEVGETVYTGIVVEECIVFYEGKLTANGASKDTASFNGTAVSNECSGSTSVSGEVTSGEFTSKGAGEFKGALLLTQGSCVFEAKKFTAGFSSYTIGGGTMDAKLDKKATGKENSKSCPASIEPEPEFVAELANGVFGEAFEEVVEKT
jgi:hypothetical protein